MPNTARESTSPARNCTKRGAKEASAGPTGKACNLPSTVSSIRSLPVIRHDHFRVVSVAASLHMSDGHAAELVSIALTIGVAACAVMVSCVVGVAVDFVDCGEGLLLRPLWSALTDSDHWLGIAPYAASPLFPGVLSLAFYWLACAPAALLDVLDNAWVRGRFKLQPMRTAQPGDWRTTLGLTLQHQLFFIIPGEQQRARTSHPQPAGHSSASLIWSLLCGRTCVSAHPARAMALR